DKPCIVLLDESGSKYKLSVSNPLNTATTVNVTLSFNGGTHENIVFTLPSGSEAGKGVTLLSNTLVSIQKTKSFIKLALTDSTSGKSLQDVQIKQIGVVSVNGNTDTAGKAFISVDSGLTILEYSKPLYRTFKDTVHVSSADTILHSVKLNRLPRAGIKLLPEKQLIERLQPFQFAAFYQYADSAIDLQDTIKSGAIWSVSSTDIASIDSTGRGVAKTQLGTAIISCSSSVDGIAGICTLTVISLQNFSPISDGFGHSGNPATNYVTSTALVVKGEGGNARISYLKFDLSALKGCQILSAKLKLFPQTLPTSPIPIRACAVDNDNWSETTLTWANQPAVGTPLDTVNLNTSALVYHEWDVTQFTESQISGDSIATYCLQDYREQVGWLSFNSKEFATNKPVLEIVILKDSIPFTVSEYYSQSQNNNDCSVAGNPFNPSCRINLSLSQTSQISIEIFNLSGHSIKHLSDGYLSKGKHSIIWNGKSDYGTPVASGLYLIHLKINSSTYIQKVSLIK
ncbi:MAG: DNRLRE domain-containing protein, partial [Fibrobacteres bacterium]|nr:DNRLRE domain-containing protein [Fibrobacterota bacterium]